MKKKNSISQETLLLSIFAFSLKFSLFSEMIFELCRRGYFPNYHISQASSLSLNVKNYLNGLKEYIKDYRNEKRMHGKC